MVNGQRTYPLVNEAENGAVSNPQNSAHWTFWDIAGIFSLCLVGTGVTGFAMLFFRGDDLVTKYVVMFVTGLLGMLAPPWWLNSRYGLFIDAVGVRKGKPNAWIYTWTGIAAVIALNGVMWQIAPAWSGPPVQLSRAVTYLDFILLPVSIGGFLFTVWGPVSEEVLFRGLLYGYLRSRLGVPVGLVVQGLLFVLVHFPFFKTSFNDGLLSSFQILFLGLVFGFLYQRTSTLYPSIICHGATTTSTWWPIIFG